MLTFEEVLDKFSYMFEGSSTQEDYLLVINNLETMQVREESANVCLQYLRDNISEMNPIMLLANLGILSIGESKGMLKFEHHINQYELDFMMAMVLKYGQIKIQYNRNCNVQNISLLLKAITIYITCVEHKLHKDSLNAYIINLWYRTSRIEGFDNDKLEIIKEFCEKYDQRTGNNKIKLENVIKLTFWVDNMIAKRLEVLSARTIYVEHVHSLFMFSENEIKGLCENSNVEFDQIKKILNMFSVNVGELKNIDEEEIYLENPICTKFIIKIGEKNYFIPNINVIAENLLGILKYIVCADNQDSNEYSKCRSDFLEEKTYDILFDKFKENGKIHLNCQWDYNNRHGENDCILIYENYAIIFEDKSGEVSTNTTKGVMGRAYTDSKKLIYDASEQAYLFSQVIQANYGKRLPLKIKGGGENVINLENVNKNIRIGIVFEDTILQNVAINGKRHSPIISIFQLNKILKCLEKYEVIDYFIKRTYIEENTFYNATEYDFLYTYLCNGINTSDKIYEKMSKGERLGFLYKEGEITRNELMREEWFQLLIDKCMNKSEKSKLDKVVSLLEIPPIVQKQIWRDVKQEKELVLLDNIAFRKKLIIVRMVDYFDNDTYKEIDNALAAYENLIEKQAKFENILYIAITEKLEKIVVELSVKGKRI